MSVRMCTVNFTFPRDWQAEVLEKPPLIAPAQHFIYPHAVEEVELGALEILFQHLPGDAPKLATFALGFADATLPHGLWSCPNPRQLCAIAGGYAYVVDAHQPEQWTQVPYRPVTSIHLSMEQRLLLFAGFHALWALGPNGKAWETKRLSWEGLRVTGIDGEQLHGFGWDIETDAEAAFTVDLKTGRHTGGAAPV